MIAVQQIDNKGNCQRIGGNPVITSLDEETVAPLQTILSDSWTAEDRAKFGIYIAEPFELPAGKVRVGPPSYHKAGTTAYEMYQTEDEPPAKQRPPDPIAEMLAKIGALTARIEALEGK